jgi:hypothetical protein
MSPGLNWDGLMREMAAIRRRANVYRLAAGGHCVNAVAYDPHHPDWTRLSAWLDVRYPQYRDPLRYWEDCEKNIENWVEP